MLVACGQLGTCHKIKAFYLYLVLPSLTYLFYEGFLQVPSPWPSPCGQSHGRGWRRLYAGDVEEEHLCRREGPKKVVAHQNQSSWLLLLQS